MPLQGENLCAIGTLFIFGRSSLTIACTACDTWRTLVCDGTGARNRGGGGGSNLSRRGPRLPLGMVGGKSSWVDVSICIDIETNIDVFGDGRTNVLNLGPSGVVKEAFMCNERWSTYGVEGTEDTCWSFFPLLCDSIYWKQVHAQESMMSWKASGRPR